MGDWDLLNLIGRLEERNCVSLMPAEVHIIPDLPLVYGNLITELRGLF